LHFAFSVDDVLQITVLDLQVGHRVTISSNISFQHGNFISELLLLSVSLRYNVFIFLRLFIKLLHYLLAVFIFILAILILLILELI